MEVTSPPMMATAMGARNSAPSPNPSAMGSMPRIVADVVMRIGRSRIGPAARIAVPQAHAPGPQLVGVIDEQDRVLVDEAEQEDQSQQRCHAEVGAGNEQPEHGAHARERQRQRNDQRILPAAEEEPQHRHDAERRESE